MTIQQMIDNELKKIDGYVPGSIFLHSSDDLGIVFFLLVHRFKDSVNINGVDTTVKEAQRLEIYVPLDVVESSTPLYEKTVTESGWYSIVPPGRAN